jgi:FlaG/FlaF family flagellin (archaellin)
MSTAQPSSAPHPHRNPSPFGDPWNEPASTASKLRTTLAVAVFIILVALFAATATAWVSAISTTPGAQQGLSAPKNSARSDRTASAEDSRLTTGSGIGVLAPRNMTGDQTAEFTARFRATPDGYFSRVSFDSYDVVINGTKSVSAAGRSGATRDASEIRISETENGLSATFNRDGANYLVEFSCPGPGNEAGVACIGEADARAFVANLVTVTGGAS